MDRWTVWDEELGSFLPTDNAKIADSKVTYYDIHLINRIGQLEDELEFTKKQRNFYIAKYNVLNRILRRR